MQPAWSLQLVGETDIVSENYKTQSRKTVGAVGAQRGSPTGVLRVQGKGSFPA